MSNIVKFARRFLMTEPFFMDGFEYQFVSVEPEDDWAIDITVNVVLPEKGQSYITDRFSYNISQIIM